MVVILSTAMIFTELALCSSQDHPDGLVALSILRAEGIESDGASEVLKNGPGPDLSLHPSEVLSLFVSQFQVLWVSWNHFRLV